MISAPLADLDELVLKCRDDKAKSSVAEAVASYRVGAYRSAIVATWIAVCFDIIDKLRELSFSGDKEAEQQVAALEKIRASGDVYNALQFEKNLLALARDKFELISHLEHIDLERLQADRNRCAHPSLVSEDQVYMPSAELARAHIHAAIVHLLQHPPAQGKHALSRLIKDLESDLFPNDKKKIIKAFSAGPLRKPRESLVRNFSLVLLKKMLTEMPFAEDFKVRTALAALRELHAAVTEKLLTERLTKMVRDMEDSELYRVVKFLEGHPDTWSLLADDVQDRLDGFVRKLPAANFEDLDFLLEFAPLKPAAELRVKYASRGDIDAGYFFVTPVAVVDRAITLYLDSKSFEIANAGAKQLSTMAYDMTAEHIRRILKNSSKNTEITNSFGLPGLLMKLRGRSIADPEFDALMQEHGLEKYLPGADEDDIPF